MIKDIISNIKESLNYNVYITDDIILRTIKNNIQFLSEFIPADIHLYQLNNNNVICIGEAKSSIYPSFYRRSHIGLDFDINDNLLFKKLIYSNSSIKGLQGEIFNNFQLYQDIYPIFNLKNKVIGILLIERSIFETKKWLLKNWFYDELLEDLIKIILYKSIYEINSLPNLYPGNSIIIINNDGIIHYSGNNALNLFSQLSRELPLEGNKIQDILYIDKDNVINQEINGLFFKQESIIENNNIEISFIPIEKYIILLIKNITEIRIKEKEIKLKSIIINEINHRVKNNLQSISSLLRLQKRRENDIKVKNILNDIINRINSISIVHEFLSYTDLDAVDISEVIKKIAEEIINTYSSPNKIIKLEFVSDNKLIISSLKSISIALIVNEIISNSLKHAFKNVYNCLITIDFKVLDNKLILRIKDNGKGFPIGFDTKKDSNLGWNIISIILEDDLKGNYIINNNEISIIIKLDNLI